MRATVSIAAPPSPAASAISAGLRSRSDVRHWRILRLCSSSRRWFSQVSYASTLTTITIERLQIPLLLRPEQGDLTADPTRAYPGSFVRSSLEKRRFRSTAAQCEAGGRIHRGIAKPSRVFAFAPADVKAIRARLGKSQTEFAQMIGVSTATLQNWEQGRRRPDGPALALLRVASAEPKAVARALLGAA